MECIEKGNFIFEFVLSLELSIWDVEAGLQTKDYNVLSHERPIETMIVIDCEVLNSLNIRNNCIPITTYRGENLPEDEFTLILLERYLVSINKATDVREEIKKKFYPGI